MRFRTLLALAAFAGALAACAVGPDYRKPDIATPTAFGQTNGPGVTTATADLTGWWTQFSDPVLEGLVKRALRDNPDLATAASRVREARRQVTVAGAAEYPSISGTGNTVTYNSNRKDTSAQGQSAAGAGGAGAAPQSNIGIPIPRHFNTYAAGFDATWEIDVFGGTRRGVEAAKADVEAQEWARRDGQVSLVAEVANDYLTLRATQARVAIGQAELQRQQDLFKLVSARRQAGFVTNLDVNQQTGEVETAAAQITQLGAQADAEVHALGVLLALPPESLRSELAGNSTTLPPPPPAIPVGLPSDLLRRRPDIREAERRLAAANARIGVQVAARYPKFDLRGIATFASNQISDVFDADNFASAALGSVTQPIFAGGRNRANVKIAREEKLQALLAYKTSILVALRDVEDALARYAAESDRRQSLARAVQASQGSLGIARDQYRTGLVTFINVLQAQDSLLNARDQLAQSDAARLTDLVALYKALGGGWTET